MSGRRGGYGGRVAARGALQLHLVPQASLEPFPLLLLQEVRLYAALCLCHILRLNAPDTPYSDEQLQVGLVAICNGGKPAV